MQLRTGMTALVAPGEPDGSGSWTAERLESWLRTTTDRRSVIAVADRAPGTMTAFGEAASAFEPLMRACNGIWIAPERLAPVTADANVRTVRLPSEEERLYYEGFVREALWPMCHRAHRKPTFRADDFTTYWRVNAQFADAVCEEVAGDAPLILVQDHPFALVPLLVRERQPHSRIVMLWQIPWPDWQTFEICPWGRHLLEGLLGSSIIGFQTPLDCRNFVETVERCLGAHIDRHQEAITYDGRQVLVRAYPTSVRWPGWWTSCSPEVEICRDSIRRQLRLPADARLGVGVDRLDHTKGIEEKFLAIERLLECYPEFRGKFVFTQLIEPSAACGALRSRVLEIRDRVNAAFGDDQLQPILVLEGDHAPSHVHMFLRAADVCYVGSLHDGMNLLSKEFVAARDDEQGVLVLSTFAGAARELGDALILNPYDVDAAASLLARALTMLPDEQQDRMRRMRSVVAEFSSWRWAAQILSDAARLRRDR
jgi:trehalose 6-phosphate synthase